MVKTTLQMLRDVDRALGDRDTDLAHAVAQRDEEVDQKNVKMIQELSAAMQQHADQVPGYLHVFSACRIVERMADFVTNIAEDVLYLCEGNILRHSGAR